MVSRESVFKYCSSCMKGIVMLLVDTHDRQCVSFFSSFLVNLTGPFSGPFVQFLPSLPVCTWYS